MSPLLPIDPYTLHCAKQAQAKVRRVEKAAGTGKFNGEWTSAKSVKTSPREQQHERGLSRFETDNTVSVWECVQPQAAFAAQVIAQNLAQPLTTLCSLRYETRQPSSAKLLDRLI